MKIRMIPSCSISTAMPLVQRTPVPWNEDGIASPDGPVDGRDFIVSTIADNVSRFRVERVASVPGDQELVDITLELTSPVTGEVVTCVPRYGSGGRCDDIATQRYDLRSARRTLRLRPSPRHIDHHAGCAAHTIVCKGIAS